jgi:2'-5' RNA ligase
MRLFVAIELDDTIRSALKSAQVELGARCAGVRWLPAHQLHLTAKFLGEVRDTDVSDVSEAVARSAAEAESFDMNIEGCGCFPKRGPARIVWAGANEVSGNLLKCIEALESEMEQVGFTREQRSFSPHITIGRVREDRSGGRIRAAADGLTLDAGIQAVASLTLMSSVLSPKGPTYAVVSRTSFKG